LAQHDLLLLSQITSPFELLGFPVVVKDLEWVAVAGWNVVKICSLGKENLHRNKIDYKSVGVSKVK
jgi:hypothetical protein